VPNLEAPFGALVIQRVTEKQGNPIQIVEPGVAGEGRNGGRFIPTQRIAPSARASLGRAFVPTFATGFMGLLTTRRSRPGRDSPASVPRLSIPVWIGRVRLMSYDSLQGRLHLVSLYALPSTASQRRLDHKQVDRRL